MSPYLLSPNPSLGWWLTHPKPEGLCLVCGLSQPGGCGPYSVNVVCSSLKAEPKDCLLLCPTQRVRAPDCYLLSAPGRRLWAKYCSLISTAQRARVSRLLIGCCLLSDTVRQSGFPLSLTMRDYYSHFPYVSLVCHENYDRKKCD